MKTFLTTTALTIGLALPAFAAGDIVGDADAGAKVFNRCKACHSIKDDSGNYVVRGGQIGPNLYGVVGRKMGAQDGFKYSKVMQDAADKGMAWNESEFLQYVQNPTKYLQEVSGDSSGRSRMTYMLKKEEDAQNVWAYLASVGPQN